MKVIVASVRKVPSEKQADFPILTALLAKSNVLLPPPDSKKKHEIAEKDTQKDKKTEIAETQNAAGEKPDQKPAVPDFQIDQVVVISANKHKEKYDQREGRIVKVLSSKLRVEILSGPAQGEEKDVQKSSVTLKEAVPKKKDSEAEIPKGNDAKAEIAKSNKLAEDLFGLGDD